jgi:oligopeptide/dipeptide ABC transporter ATP-binding protein
MSDQTSQHMTDDVSLVTVRGLVKHFPIEGSRDVVHAVDGVDLSIARGETLGLVGESGCGKTTLGRLLLRLLEPTAGQILLDGRDLVRISTGALRRLRSRMQIIFQDPFSSLNPRMTVQTLLERPMQIHLDLPPARRRAAVDELLEQVGLQPEHRSRLPHEFSGGQRQRIAIARALSVQPDFVVLDEPTSALDVSVQAQILNLLKRLQRERRLTYLFISHDLSTIRHMSDRIAVMYLGQVVEVANRAELFASPQHPYTRALISAIPAVTRAGRRERIRLVGDVPSAIRVPSGCRFHTRCPFAIDHCRSEVPRLREVAPTGSPSHIVSCHLVPDVEPVAQADRWNLSP